MLCFPQISTGAVAQYPLKKRVMRRRVLNEMPGGAVVRGSDPDSMIYEWELRYSGLSDAERAAFESFFEAVEGRLGTFVFLDPMGNLLRWSGDLSRDVWTADGMLQVADGISGPNGEAGASRLTNTGQSMQGIGQVAPAPASLRYVLSCYVRSEGGCAGELSMGGVLAQFEARAKWQRVICTGTPGAGDEFRCGLSIEGGGVVEVYGLQLEAQPMPSPYKPTAQVSGIHAARLGDDRVVFTAHGRDDHSLTLRVISRAGG